MDKVTIQEFQEDFDNYIDKVENGQSLFIIGECGKEVLLTRCTDDDEVSDEFVRINTNHEDGC